MSKLNLYQFETKIFIDFYWQLVGWSYRTHTHSDTYRTRRMYFMTKYLCLQPKNKRKRIRCSEKNANSHIIWYGVAISIGYGWMVNSGVAVVSVISSNWFLSKHWLLFFVSRCKQVKVFVVCVRVCLFVD